MRQYSESNRLFLAVALQYHRERGEEGFTQSVVKTLGGVPAAVELTR